MVLTEALNGRAVQQPEKVTATTFWLGRMLNDDLMPGILCQTLLL